MDVSYTLFLCARQMAFAGAAGIFNARQERLNLVSFEYRIKGGIVRMKYRKSGSRAALSMLILFSVTLSGCGRGASMQEGIAALTDQQYEAAMECFDEAGKAGGMFSAYSEGDVLLYHAEAAVGAGQYEQAVADYDAWLSGEREGTDPGEVYRLRGVAQLYAGSIGEAIEDLLCAKQEYTKEDCSFYLGIAYLKNGEYEKALAQFSEEKSDSPDRTEIYYYEAVCREYMGDFGAAADAMEIYLEHHPEDEGAQEEYRFLKSR